MLLNNSKTGAELSRQKWEDVSELLLMIYFIQKPIFAENVTCKKMPRTVS